MPSEFIEANEPILRPNPDRFITILGDPRYKAFADLHHQHKAAYWVDDEVNLEKDLNAWPTVPENLRHLVLQILTYFFASDGIVNENLAVRFIKEIQIPEIRNFYAHQMAAEVIHSQTYSKLIQAFVTDEADLRRRQKAIDGSGSIRRKADWARFWISDSSHDFRYRLIAFLVVEGIFFSCSFCFIFWLKVHLPGKLPGLYVSNEWISRDEGLHCLNAVLAYLHIVQKLPVSEIHRLFRSGVEAESEFVRECLPNPLPGMNVELMIQYVQYVADFWLTKLGVSKLYHVENPFPFMNLIDLDGKSNFFERQASEYQKAVLSHNDPTIFACFAQIALMVAHEKKLDERAPIRPLSIDFAGMAF